MIRGWRFRWKASTVLLAVIASGVLLYNEYAIRIRPISFRIFGSNKIECFSGEVVTAVGEFRNRTLFPIKLQRIHALCGCTTTDLTDSQKGCWIPPGASLSLKFTINTQGKYSSVDFGGAVELVDMLGRKTLSGFELVVDVEQPWFVSKDGFRSEHAGVDFQACEEFYIFSDSDRVEGLLPAVLIDGDGILESELLTNLELTESGYVLSEMRRQLESDNVRLLGKIRFRWSGALGSSESVAWIRLKHPALPDATGATVKLVARRQLGSFFVQPDSIFHRNSQFAESRYAVNIIARGSEPLFSVEPESMHAWVKFDSIEELSNKRWRVSVQVPSSVPTGSYRINLSVNNGQHLLPVVIEVINEQ